MKLKYFALSAIVALFGLSSCEDDNSGGGSLEPVVILDGTGEFISGDATVDAGSDISFRLTAAENEVSGSNLRRLTINRVFNNTPQLVLDTMISGSSFGPLTINTTARTEAGDENFIFEVTDKDDEIGRVSLVITTTVTTPFVEETGVIYHIKGQLQGAYDLQLGMLRSATENDDIKDMINVDCNPDGSTRTFSGSWEAGNGTMFKMASANFDYDNANAQNTQFDYTVTQLAVAPTAGINNPQAGDVYLFNLRGNNVYGAIRITSVEPDFSTGTGANRGRMNFTFKRDN